MLMTVKHEARRVGFIMPAPERMWKVLCSNRRLKVDGLPCPVCDFRSESPWRESRWF